MHFFKFYLLLDMNFTLCMITIFYVFSTNEYDSNKK